MENEKSTARDNDLEIVEIAEFKRDNTHKKIAKHEESKAEAAKVLWNIDSVCTRISSRNPLLHICIANAGCSGLCSSGTGGDDCCLSLRRQDMGAGSSDSCWNSCRSSIWSVIPDDCWGDCISGSGSGIVWIAECSS